MLVSVWIHGVTLELNTCFNVKDPYFSSEKKNGYESDIFTWPMEKKKNSSLRIPLGVFLRRCTSLIMHSELTPGVTFSLNWYMFTQDVSEGKLVPFSFYAYHSHPLQTCLFFFFFMFLPGLSQPGSCFLFEANIFSTFLILGCPLSFSVYVLKWTKSAHHLEIILSSLGLKKIKELFVSYLCWKIKYCLIKYLTSL